jgi:Icc-related predicted phosphoesterase
MPKILQNYGALGVISDLHNDKITLKKSIDWFKQNSLDAIILAGDTPGYTKSSFVSIIKKLLKLNIPIVIFPGSHENNIIYNQTMTQFKGNKKLIDAVNKNNRLIKYGDWELVMIPGSCSLSSAPRKFWGGTFWLFDKIITPTLRKRINNRLQSISFAREASPISIIDNYKLLEQKSITKGSKKIVFAHDPIRCKTKNGIDIAHFGIIKKDFSINKKHLKLKAFKELDWKGDGNFKTDHITMINKALLLKKYGYPVKIKKTHVGNQFVNKFLKKYKINKFICGHIHECGMRAIDKEENKVKSNIATSSLFLNSGPKTATIIKLNKNKIAYYFM